MAAVVVLAMLGTAFGVAVSNVDANEGARDSEGYRWTDSLTPAPSVSFNWVEINTTATNTSISGSSNYGGPFPIGFSFEFYGNTYTEFYANTEGYISFGSSSYDSSNDYMPDTWTPNNIIAPYWDNMANYAGTICYQTIGATPYQQLIIEWQNVTRSGYSDLMIFEVMLNESGEIWFQYLQLGGQTGWSATVGIENADGTIACQYSYGSYSLQDGLAIRFSKGPVWVGPSQSQSGRTNTDLSYNLTVTNLQPFSDSFAVTNASTLGWTVGLYESSMTPLTDTDGDTIVDTGTIPGGTSVNITVVVTIPAIPSGGVESTTITVTSFASSLVFYSCYLTTTALDAWFDPPHSDWGRDTNADGLFNYLVVEVSVYVREPGYYYLEGDLYTGTGGYITYDDNYTSLAAGANKVWLMYFGWLLRETSENGPYDIHLYLRDDSWTVIGDEWHSTQAYAYTDFMLVPGYFTSPHSDSASDTDSDGLYDVLYLDASVYVNYAGRFIATCYLYTSTNWSYVGYRSVTVDLLSGTNSVQFTYNAWDIARANDTATFYAYLYLSAYVDSVPRQVDSDYHTTGSYLLSAFERPAVLFAPPHHDHAIDSDSDSLFEWLVIDVEVSVAVEGDYIIEGELSSYGGVIDTITNSTHLTIGYHVIEMAFPGWPIRYMDDSDWFDCALEARSGATVLDNDDYETATYYYYWEFDTAPGWFEPPHSYQMVDLDSDTLIDYVSVEVGVNVTVTGDYRVYIEFYRYWWDVIYQTSNVTHLNAGLSLVEFTVPGWLIRSSGDNGPYDIDLYLYDVEDRNMAFDTFSTAYYAYTAFETTPALFSSPHEYSIWDDDGDGQYDRLVVNATVDVASAGDFYLEGVLYAGGAWWVSTSGAWATLATGIHVVEISFPGWMIEQYGWYGTYSIDLELYDSNMYWLDSDWLTTVSYDYSIFDGSVPRISSTWASTAPLVDGIWGIGEWSGGAVVSLQEVYPPNEIAASMYFTNDGTTLYIAFDVYGDMTDDTYDYSSLAFDTDNDNAATAGHEDQFQITGDSSDPHTHYTYSGGSWTAHCSPFSETGLAGAAGFGPSNGHAMSHRIYEYAIPLLLIEAAPGDVLGFLGRSTWYYGVYDYATDLTSSWPVYFSGSPSIGEFGELALALSGAPSPPSTSASVSGTVGLAGWHRSAVSVSLSVTGGVGGINCTQYSLDGGLWITYSSAIAISTDGTHTLSYRSIDNSSQTEATKTLTVKIDTLAPVTATEVSGANVWLNVSDVTSGLGGVKYRIDNGTWQTYTGVIEVTGVGMHTVDFYSTDAAGNQESTDSVIVEVEQDGGGFSGLSGSLMLIGLIAAIVVALLIMLLVLMRRKKGQQPNQMAPQPMPPSLMPPTQ